MHPRSSKPIRRVAVLAVAVAMTSARAAGPSIVVAGGELDGGIVGAEVYVGVPRQAEPCPGRACQAAKSYVDLINSGQFAEVADLFQDDAVILEPTRRGIRGHDQVRDFYESAIGKLRPELVAVAYLGDDTDCMVELAVQREVNDQLRHVLVSIDHFTLGTDGKIARMVAFVRPPGID